MVENPYSREVMEQRFQDLKEKIDKIEAESPRHERDRLYETLNPVQLAEFRKRILAHEEGLFDLKQQYASLARALKTVRK